MPCQSGSQRLYSGLGAAIGQTRLCYACGRLFVRHGGTQKANPNGEGLSNIRELEPWQAVAEDTDGGYSYLKTLPTVRSGRLGLVGFGWGGEMTFASATEVRGFEAVVVFYGHPRPLERLEKIQAPVLSHYGEKDPGVKRL